MLNLIFYQINKFNKKNQEPPKTFILNFLNKAFLNLFVFLIHSLLYFLIIIMFYNLMNQFFIFLNFLFIKFNF
jgi:hypothetical protein